VNEGAGGARLRIVIDKDECLSAGKCVADHPEAFGFDDDELAEVLPGAAALDDDTLLRAARRCPSGALRVIED
jgi:ferredoxin